MLQSILEKTDLNETYVFPLSQKLLEMNNVLQQTL